MTFIADAFLQSKASGFQHCSHKAFEGKDGNEDDEEILIDCVATVMDLAVNDD